MSVQFTLHERSALYGLLANHSTDIILKTDAEGRVLDASPAIERLGMKLHPILIGPRLSELIHPAYRELIEDEHRDAVCGLSSGAWLEVPAVPCGRKPQWFEVQVRPLFDRSGSSYGALVVMRCIAMRKSLEEQLFAAEYTDPLTRLTNRIAFVSMLDHLIAGRERAALALFDLDHFMTLNMRYGQSAGDELLRAFADLLRATTRNQDIISRVGGERFGVIMPHLAADQAAALCRPIIETLAEASTAALGSGLSVTASVGVAGIARSTDNTVKRAELALFLAKAKGRSRIEIGAQGTRRRIAAAA